MSLVLEVLAIIIIFFLFASSHSFLAAFDVKKRIAEKVGSKIAFYRLFYNIISIMTFIAVYYISPKPGLIIYDLQFPYDMIIFAIQFLGVIGLFWSGSYIDMKEFLGINQIKRYMNGTYRVNDVDEYHQLVIKGPFKLSRHPIYFFSIVILGFRSTMDLFYLVFFICILVYFYVGSIYEEKSLEKRFGGQYLKYKSQVPRLIPNPFLLSSKIEG
ncbi:MAG: isoprenylcysteine carboxylmethyltransferase family protein [Melioribacteraceae bacterium]|nr:isoprenylcysteine carboxylmethyltransferase family protein [Melioribacteraceae bacterium]